LEACPAPWKESLDVWLTPIPEAFLLARIKKTFDPKGIFSPGRFAGKI
jgi:FAD/FMN-containing dehydrogenase